MAETTIAGLLRQVTRTIEAFKAADDAHLSQLIDELEGLNTDYLALPTELRQMAEKYLPNGQ